MATKLKTLKVLFNDGTTDEQVEQFVENLYQHFEQEMPEITFATDVCEETMEEVVIVDDIEFDDEVCDED